MFGRAWGRSNGIVRGRLGWGCGGVTIGGNGWILWKGVLHIGFLMRCMQCEGMTWVRGVQIARCWEAHRT